MKENIAAFGGDAADVTVAGESAGAFNVFSLLVSPMASRLFQRAVAESGLARAESIDTAERAARTITLKVFVRRGKAKDLQDAERVPGGMTNADVRSLLYSVPTIVLLRSLDRSPAGLGMADHPTSTGEAKRCSPRPASPGARSSPTP